MQQPGSGSFATAAGTHPEEKLWAHAEEGNNGANQQREVLHPVSHGGEHLHLALNPGIGLRDSFFQHQDGQHHLGENSYKLCIL